MTTDREGDPSLVALESPKNTSRAWLALRRDRRFWFGSAAILFVAIVAVLAPVLAPHDPDRQFPEALGLNGPVGPNAEFLLGADDLGRDLLSRLIFGARTSLGVAVPATFISTVLGLMLGATAAQGRRLQATMSLRRHRLRVTVDLESVVMRLTDLFLAFPVLLLGIVAVVIVGPGLLLVTLIIASVLWAATARTVYARLLAFRRADFVEAAIASGISPRRILLRHLLPQALPVVIVSVTTSLAASVLLEATFAFLGIGVPLPTASWGSMVAEHVGYLTSDARLVYVPGLAISLTVFAINELGDSLASALDPLQSDVVAARRSGRRRRRRLVPFRLDIRGGRSRERP